MKKMTLIDEIIKEPLGGAHANRELMFKILRKKITKTHQELSQITVKQLIKERMQKYCDMGVYQE